MTSCYFRLLQINQKIIVLFADRMIPTRIGFNVKFVYVGITIQIVVRTKKVIQHLDANYVAKYHFRKDSKRFYSHLSFLKI